MVETGDTEDAGKMGGAIRGNAAISHKVHATDVP